MLRTMITTNYENDGRNEASEDMEAEEGGGSSYYTNNTDDTDDAGYQDDVSAIEEVSLRTSSVSIDIAVDRSKDDLRTPLFRYDIAPSSR